MSLENIFVPQGPVTVVLGNMGRRPYLIRYYLEVYHREGGDIRLVLADEEDEETVCEMLVWLEPSFGETIVKPAYCRFLLVFSSHLFLSYGRNVRVVAHHIGPSYIRDDLNSKRQEPFLESPDPSAEILLVPKPFHDRLLPEWNNTFYYNVCVDLTSFSTTHRVFLALLNAYDFLRLYHYKITSWSIALPTRFRKTLAVCLDSSRARLTSKIPSNVDCIRLLETLYLHDDEMILSQRNNERGIVAEKHVADDEEPEW